MNEVPFRPALRRFGACAARTREPSARASLAIALGLLASLCACATYDPRPLDPARELASLKSATLEALAASRDDSVGDSGSQPKFDVSDGLDESEIVSIALTLNRELEAKRAEIGEATALLISAGLLPNPQVDASLEYGLGGGNSMIGGNLDWLFQLLRRGERAARRDVATAHLDAVRCEVVADEYRLAAEVRKAYISLRSADKFVTLAEQESVLRDQAATIVDQRKNLGEATALDFALVDLERSQFQRILRDARSDRAARLRALITLMGLPPNTDPRLFDSTHEVATAPPSLDLADDEVDAALLAGRLDLRAAEANYKTSEAELALAITRQPPRIGVGPSVRKEPGGVTSLGAAVSLEVPVFDRNEGEIAEKEAARSKARADYIALLQERRSDAFDSRAALRIANAEVELQEHELLPQLGRTETLFDGAFKSRELTVFEWLTARNRILEARRDYLEALTKRARATADFESAIGAPIAPRTTISNVNPNHDGSKP